MFPWYIGIRDNHINLDIEETGTFDEFTGYHHDMEAPKKTPSGHSFMYGKVPYSFPADTQLTGLGAVSDALVGRRHWRELDVLAEVLEWVRCSNGIEL